MVPAYAALLALFFVALSIRTLRLRRELRITVGDGGNPAMLRAMRVHANFAEYVPLGLILLPMNSMNGNWKRGWWP
ncbi:MAG TPA: glutathione metabolism protein, partial [Candidatus Accumulibacter sp.]|nr:glutathione metabolism protein [Accumulibacter sp.]